MATLVKDLMRAPVTLDEETSQMGLVEAQMKIADVRHVLIVDGTGRLTGIVSRGDVIRAQDREGHHSVREFMTRRIWTVRPEMSAAAAIDVLVTRGVGAAPVIDADDKPVGIISEVDFLKIARTALE
jgi:CBS domain-containing protein